MKNKRFWPGILLLVFGMTVAGCNNPTGNNNANNVVIPPALRGTWSELEGNGVFTITINTISMSDQIIYTATAVEQVINTHIDENVTVNFPSGYRITLILTTVPEGFEEHLGVEDVVFFFLSTDGGSSWTGNPHEPNSALPPYNVWNREI